MGSTTPPTTIRVAVTQHEPAWLDLAAGVTKTCSIIASASAAGAKLVAFPECWIPGYPAWIWTRPVDFSMGVRYVNNSLAIDSPEMRTICSSAAEHDINVHMGFSERSGQSVYIAQALIDSSGTIRVRRRKMKPTHMERTIFGDASGDCLSPVIDIAGVGKVGGLSCWEHIQPLLKFYTFSQGEEIHVAAWPVLEPYVEGHPGFWSMTTEGLRAVTQTYAVEAQAFVLSCTTLLTSKGIEVMGTAGSPMMGCPNVGSSCVIGPDGRVLADSKTAKGEEGTDVEEELILCELDMSLITKTKTFADATGHYSRPDLMWIGVDKRVKGMVREES